jgi:homoserine kinase
LTEPFRTVRVPASSANLGPGFDALGIALNVFLECRFRRAEALSIRVSGVDADRISTGEDNLIWQIALGVGASAIELEILNAIPVGKGLGSSAAAVTAGVLIGSEVAGLGWDRTRVLDEVARIEGHPDNASACVLGGIVASATDLCGAVHAVKMPLPEKFGVAVVVPDFAVATSEAREVLPASYSRADAIFNIQRAALLIASLAAGDADAMRVALEDRLHHPYRFGLVRGLEEMVALRETGLLGCVLSGAGPSVLVFYLRGCEGVCEHVRGIFARHGHASEVLWTRVAENGYELLATNGHE